LCDDGIDVLGNIQKEINIYDTTHKEIAAREKQEQIDRLLAVEQREEQRVEQQASGEVNFDIDEVEEEGEEAVSHHFEGGVDNLTVGVRVLAPLDTAALLDVTPEYCGCDITVYIDEEENKICK
jgi:hypothetical protein